MIRLILIALLALLLAGCGGKAGSSLVDPPAGLAGRWLQSTNEELFDLASTGADTYSWTWVEPDKAADGLTITVSGNTFTGSGGKDVVVDEHNGLHVTYTITGTVTGETMQYSHTTVTRAVRDGVEAEITGFNGTYKYHATRQ